VSETRVVIIGAGLAGLACAVRLHEAGFQPLILEAAADVGGRVRTENVAGFLLDRGFQVMLTAYPEANRLLDLQALDLQRFAPGALIRHGSGLHVFADPWRRPADTMATLRAPIGGFGDKLRVGRLRSRVGAGTVEDVFRRPERTTLEALRDAGFSAAIVDGFFRPFLGGVFLERDLRTSSRMFEFVFRMFAEGHAALPAAGMQAVPRQLAKRLPDGTIRLGKRVTTIGDGEVGTEDGDRFAATATVVACDEPAAAQLLGRRDGRGARAVTCLYYAADTPPIEEPLLVLNGEGRGPINNLCVPSQVAPTYAPDGAALISVSVLGNPSSHDSVLDAAVRDQLRGWFGRAVDRWQPLRTYRIAYALPDQAPPLQRTAARGQRDSIHVCGDYLETGSIEGALRSGRRAAEAIIGAPEG